VDSFVVSELALVLLAVLIDLDLVALAAVVPDEVAFILDLIPLALIPLLVLRRLSLVDCLLLVRDILPALRSLQERFLVGELELLLQSDCLLCLEEDERRTSSLGHQTFVLDLI